MSLETFFSTNIIVPIIVAFIGFLIAVTTAVIAKEQKVSEFRQAWINSLREHFAALIVFAHKYRSSKYDICHIKIKNINAKNEHALTTQYNSSAFEFQKYFQLVKFYLNPKEQQHACMITDCENILKLIQTTDSDLDNIEELKGWDDEIQLQIYQLSDKIPELLKMEWERVKIGEKRFVIFRNASELCLFAVISAIFSAVSVYILLVLVTKFPEYFLGIS